MKKNCSTLLAAGVARFSALTVSALTIFVFQAQAAQPIALVYSGAGACKEGCSKAAARIFRRVGYKVTYVDATTLKASLLKKAAVYVQPGGNAIKVAQAFSPRQMELLRNFIYDGGGYVGFCAGAFFVDREVDDDHTIPGLNLLPGTTFDYIRDDEARILPLNWRGRIRHLFFQNGPYFRIDRPDGVTVVATYPNRLPAVVKFRYGSGRIVASGVHPEAPAKWVTDYKHGLVDPDGRDFDLAEDLAAWAGRIP